MKLLFATAFIALSLASCSTSRFTAPRNISITNLGIRWNETQLVDTIYKSLIDTSINKAIYRFNNEIHSFKAHNGKKNDPYILDLSFEGGKFIKKGGLIAGYVISGLGLIATPIHVISSSNGKLFLAFWYFPSDRLAANVRYISVDTRSETRPLVINRIALFSNKRNRLIKMSNRLERFVYNMLVQIDESNTK